MKGVMQYLCSEDDAEVDEIIQQEYSLFMRISGAYPNLKTFRRKVLSILHFMLLNYIWLQYFSIFLFRAFFFATNFIEFVTALHFAIIYFLTLSCFWNFTINRPRMARSFKVMSRCCYKYDTETELHRNSYRSSAQKNKQILMKIVPGYFILVGFIVCIVGPIMNYIAARAGAQSGAPVKAPRASWVPYRTDTPLGAFIAAFQRFLVTATLSSFNSVSLVSNMQLSQWTSSEIEMLIKSLELLPQRAERLFRRYKCNSDVNTSGLDDNLLRMECYRQCLKQNATHYQNILRYYNDVRTLVSYPIFSYFLLGTVIIALAASSTILVKGSIGSVIANVNLGVFELMTLIIYSWCGQKMKQTSEDLRSAMYATNWYHLDKSCSKSLGIMFSRAQIPMELSGIGLFPADYEALGNAMKSAYSYFNLILAFAGIE